VNIINKKLGETPLEALECFRIEQIKCFPHKKLELQNISMTYAGRLDPMAEGLLIILSGDECKDRDKYTDLDKTYEIEIVFGIETDSYDALGLIKSVNCNSILENSIDISKYIGKKTQSYPPFSSKTVNGIELHNLARSGDLPDIMPKREIEIYSLNKNGSRYISGLEIYKRASNTISLVRGDFRQSKILKGWDHFAKKYAKNDFMSISLVVCASSGTYMRSLAKDIGDDVGVGAFAMSIKRTKIADYSAKNVTVLC
jgi:tRNA pseudouridine55 synthase